MATTGIRGWLAAGLASLLVTGCGADAGLDQHGRKVTAESLADQWLIINYWAPWCAPCRKEIPQLNQLSRELDDGTQILGVNFDGLQGQALLDASRQMGIEFRVLAEDPAARFGLPERKILPVTFIIGPDGELREQLLGEQTADGLRAKLTALREVH